RRPPRRGDGGSALPGNRYSPRSGYRPSSAGSSRGSSGRGQRDRRDQNWREEDWRSPPTIPRSSSGRGSPSPDAWEDMPTPRQPARTGYAGESGPRARASRYRDDAWTPASARNGRGRPPKKTSSRTWLFAVLGLLLIAVPTAIVISQWSRIQALTGL